MPVLNSVIPTFSVMLQPTEETSDRTKHKFMVQSMCLERDVPLDELDGTVRYNFVVAHVCSTCTGVHVYVYAFANYKEGRRAPTIFNCTSFHGICIGTFSYMLYTCMKKFMHVLYMYVNFYLFMCNDAFIVHVHVDESC